MDQRTKRALWIAAGAVFVVALVVHHNITTQEIIIFCVIVPSIILHEVSHGWVANAFGDDTAKRAGRLTPEPGRARRPRRDADRSGAAVARRSSASSVGPSRCRSTSGGCAARAIKGVLVSLAGPAMNAVLAAHLRGRLRARRPARAAALRDTSRPAPRSIFYASLVNVGLCVFNMIPIPPLDGSVLFERLLPARYWPTYLRYRQYTMPILLGLVLLNFFLYPHGPLTWLFDHLYSWWASVLGDTRLSPGGSSPMASAARA